MDNFVQITSNILTILPSAINNNCLQLRKNESNSTLQNIVTGNTKGQIIEFQRIKGQMEEKFKTDFIEKEINSVQSLDKERIFYAIGSQIGAINDSGQSVFLKQSNIIDQIQHTCISNDETCINTVTDYQISKYKFNYMQNDIEEIYNFTSDSKINTIHAVSGNSILVGCKDNTLQYFNEDLKQESSLKTTSMLLKIEHFQEQNVLSRYLNRHNNKYMLGYQNGLVQQISMENPQTISEKFQIVNQNSGITNLGIADTSQNGKNEIMVSNENQKLEIYSLNINQEPELFWEKQLTDSITNIKGGLISNENLGEFVVSNFSGEIHSYLDADFKFQEDQNLINLRNPDYGKSIKNQEKQKETKNLENLFGDRDIILNQQNQIDNLKREIANLEEDIKDDENDIKQDLKQNTLPSFSHQNFKIQAELKFNTEQVYYSLQIKCELNIEIVALQGDFKASVIKQDKQDQIGIISENGDTEFLRSTLRFIEQDYKTVEIRLRCYEGEKGEINIFVIPKDLPRNCQSLKINLKCLQLHQKKEIPITQDQKNCMNFLKFNGGFSVDNMHLWIQEMIPDIQTLLTEDFDDEQKDRNINEVQKQYETMQFQQMYTGSILCVDYKDGEAIFFSDCVSTLGIIKNFIVEKTTERQIQIDIKYEVKPEMVQRILKLIDQKITAYKHTEMQYKLIPALKEMQQMFQSDEQNQKLQQKGENDDFISENPEYLDILEREEEITKMYHNLPKTIDFVKGLIVGIYVDYNKFRLKDIDNQKLNYLNNLIEKKYDIAKLINFCQN